MQAAPVIVLLASIVLLAVAGGGMFAWTLGTVTIALSLGLRPWRWRARTADLPRSPLALLFLYLLLMLLPMRAGLSGLSGTERAQQNRIVAETLDAASAADVSTGVSPLFSMTRSRAGTVRFLFLLIPVIAGFRIITLATWRQREGWLRALLAVAAAMALAGIISRWIVPQGNTLLWIIPVPHGLPGPMGGFMNRNHFAGFCAMLSPAAAYLAIHDLGRRRFLAALFNIAAAMVLSLGVFLALSRGGMLAWAAGVGTLLATPRRHGRITRMTAAATLLLITVGALALQHAPVRERMLSLRHPGAESSVQSRLDAWRDSLRIWRQYPLLGAGPNAFRAVYPQHRTTTARDARDFAENEYVQWLAETGIAGTLLLAWGAVILVRRLGTAWREAGPAVAGQLAAATGALVAAAVHALVDFPMHLPLYALTLGSLTGMLWPAAPPTPPPPGGGPDDHPHAWIGAAGLAACLLLPCVDLRLDQAGRLAGTDLTETARALAAAPSSPIAWRRLAALLWEEGTPSARTLAERCLSQAAAYDPNNYPLWRRLGDVRQELGDRRGAMDAYQRVKTLRPWVNVPTRVTEGGD